MDEKQQKQEIQAMAKVLYGHYCGNDECGKCKEPNCLEYRRAERLYNAGCRMCGGESCTNFKHYEAECKCCTETMELKQRLALESAEEKARKGTAKEILQNMLGKMYKLTGCGVPYHVRAFIKEFSEQYGVEVEE